MLSMMRNWARKLVRAMLSWAHTSETLEFGYKAIDFMTRKGPASVEWLTPELAKEFGVAWAMLQSSRAIPIPPQPNLQRRVQAPPQVIAAWSQSARSHAD